MTCVGSQVLVLGDKAVTDWLHDRFGFGAPGDPLVGNKILMEFSRSEGVRLHVSFFVGADDLAAFPLVDPSGKEVIPG